MESGAVRSCEDKERAICSLPTVMPFPRGPSSSKAFSNASPKMCSDVEDVSGRMGCVGVNGVVDVASARVVISLCIGCIVFDFEIVVIMCVSGCLNV